MSDHWQRQTEATLAALVGDARPVRRLPGVGRHLTWWLIVSVVSTGALVLAFGLRPDLSDRLRDMRFVLELGAALGASVLAAISALCATRPGYPQWVHWLGVPPLMIWFATLGEGCWRWLASTAPGASFKIDPSCLPYIAVIGIVPATALMMLLRRGAPVHPRLALFNAALAAAALGAAAVRLFHQQDASVMILVWHAGAVGVLAAVGALLGRSLFRWPHEAHLPRGPGRSVRLRGHAASSALTCGKSSPGVTSHRRDAK